MAFDARLAEGHLIEGPDNPDRDEFLRSHKFVVSNHAVFQVVRQTTRDHLGRFGIAGGSPTYAERRERLEDFALDVIARHERGKRERGWFGWFLRWRGGGA